MIIRGGQIHIFDKDVLPTITVTGAVVVMDVPESAGGQEFADFLRARIGPESSVTYCSFRSAENWSRQQAKESILRICDTTVTGTVTLSLESQQPKKKNGQCACCANWG